MSKLKLKLPVTHKEIKLGNKIIKIPKLGLKHYDLLKNLDKKPDEMLMKLVKSIHPRLSSAETDYVLLQTLMFNKMVPETITIDDIVYDLNNAYISCETTFTAFGKTYKFSQPKYNQTFDNPIDILNALTKDDIKFENEPAACLRFVYPLMQTINLDTHIGSLHGIFEILNKGNRDGEEE